MATLPKVLINRADYQIGGGVALRLRTQEAANRGNAEARYNLGVIYEHGDGVLQNWVKAAKWYHLAADQGYAAAQSNLGAMYDKGEGVPQNYQKALNWYRKAADQGNSTAQYNIGSMYATGHGVSQDDVTAHFWFCYQPLKATRTRRKIVILLSGA
jgi:hypothetical protein